MDIKPETGGALPDNPAAAAWISGIDLTMYPSRRQIALRWLGAVFLPAICLVVLSDALPAALGVFLHASVVAVCALVFIYAGYLVLKTGMRRVEVSRESITAINFLGTRRSLPLKEIVSASIAVGNKGRKTLVMKTSANELHIASNALSGGQLEQIQTLLTANGGPCPLLEVHPAMK